MTRTLLLFSISAGLFAQSNTTFQKVFSNVASWQTTTSSSPVTNIGQIGHQALLILKDVGPGPTCVTAETTGTITIDGSYDNVIYTPFNSPASLGFPTILNAITPAGKNIGYAIVNAQGLFPYVRVSVHVGGGTVGTCIADAWYSGTSTGTVGAPRTWTGSGELASFNSTGSFNQAAIAERGPRRSVSVTPTVGLQATSTIAGSPGLTTFVDCITASLTANAALGVASADVLKATSSLGPVMWQIPLGLPNGAAAGTVVTHSICGLGLNAGAGAGLTVGFGVGGLANVIESLSYSYYWLSN